MSIRVLFHEQWPVEKGSYADNYVVRGAVVFFLSESLWEMRYDLRKSYKGPNVLEFHPKKLGAGAKVECPYMLAVEWPRDSAVKSLVEVTIKERMLGVLVACTDGV